MRTYLPESSTASTLAQSDLKMGLVNSSRPCALLWRIESVGPVMCQDMCFGCFDANQERTAAMSDQRDEWEPLGCIVINSVSRGCMAPRMNDHVVNCCQRIEG